MRDDSTIQVFKDKAGKYRFRLVSDQNGQTVGQCVRGYASLLFLYQDIDAIKRECLYEAYHNLKGTHWFRALEFGRKGKTLLRSQGYSRKVDRDSGIEACKNAATAGRVALLFSEDSSVWELDELLKNPDLGVVYT